MKLIKLIIPMMIGIYSIVCAQNTPPSITFSQPSKHQHLDAGNVQLAVDAVDAEDNIEEVVILWGDSVLVEFNAPPYQYLWENVEDGFYQLSAKVSDGFYSRSTNVDFYVGDEKIWRPYLGYPVNLPGRIEVEHFDRGGPGIAYFDNDKSREGCTGWQCRPDELVDIGATIDEAPGGETYNFFIGWTFPGNEWLEYTVQVDSTTQYVLKARIAAAVNNRSFHLEIDGNPITDTIFATHTKEFGKNEFYNYKNIYYTGVELNKGVHTLRLVIHNMGSGYGGINFNYIEFLYPEKNPPFIQFISPAATDTVIQEGDDLTIKVNAYDNETKVVKTEFYKGSTLIGTDTTYPYSLQLKNLEPGEFRLSAKAYDTEGNSEVTLVKYVSVMPISSGLTQLGKSSLNLWPNPFINKIYLDLPHNASSNYIIKLYAPDGTNVPVTVKAYDEKMVVNITEDLTPGLYLLNVSSIHGVQTFKLIKNP